MGKKTMLISGLLNVSIVAFAVGLGSHYYAQEELKSKLLKYDSAERYCLTQNIFFEARNQKRKGQEAIAWVTLNRVSDPRYPDTICGVVWDEKQFSWTHDGKPDRPSKNVVEQRAWKKAEDIALDVLMQYITDQPDPIDGAIMYHADYVNPYWTEHYAMIDQIGSHIFYR